MMETMQTPTTRAEFERRLHLLREKISQGKMHFADEGMTSGIKKVRYLPNGRIDLLSINESVRLKANMTIQWESEAFRAMLNSQKTQGEPIGSVSEDTKKTQAD